MKFTAVSLFLFVSLSLFAQKIDTQKIDDYINHIENNNRGIGSISIFKDGQEVYNRSFGQSKLENVTYDASTKYQVGSITKMITATLIFKLIENKKIRLRRQTCLSYYPQIPNASNITIKNLLEHTSGLGDYAIKEEDTKWLANKVTEKVILDEIIKQGVAFQPNEKMKYSNSGYYLLTRILEKKYKKPYATIVEENIVKPLQLTNFSSLTPKNTNTFDSFNYDDNWHKMTEFEFSNVIGLGDIAATTKDLNIFINALFQYKFLKKETIEAHETYLQKRNVW